MAAGQVQVTVLASNGERATLAALRKAGLAVQATARANKLIVGQVSPEKLADVAVLDTVRRIEPTEPLGSGDDGGIVGVDRGDVAHDRVDARRVLGLGGPGQGIGETIDGDDERAVRDHPLDGGTPDP
jgi:hypothetical protein